MHVLVLPYKRMLDPSDASKKIALDVRDFAVPSPRRGSIEPGSGYGFTEATTLGIEVHKTIQQQRKGEFANYRSEVKISHKFEHRGHTILVAGRIDGLFQSSACEAVETSVLPPARSNNLVENETECPVPTSDSQNTQKGPSLDQPRLVTNTSGNVDTERGSESLSVAKPVLHALANTSTTRQNNGSEQNSALARTLGSFASSAPRTSPQTTNPVSQLNLFRASLPAETVSRSTDRPHIEEIKTAFSAAKLAQKLRLNPWHPYCLQVKRTLISITNRQASCRLRHYI